MTAVASTLNTLFNFLFGLAYGALKWFGPFWSLAGIACLAGILMVWIFGKVSNQAAIERTRNRLSAELIGLRLFKDDLRVFFGIQFQVLAWTLKYLRYSIVPMLILMAPTVIILIQLNLHYGFRPLRVGETALVKVKLRDASAVAAGTSLTLRAPESLRVETPGVRVPDLKEICWRVRGVQDGRFDLIVSDGKDSMTKQFAVGGRLEGVSPIRTGEDWLSCLLNPGEAPIPVQSAIESIEIRYPALDILILGKRTNWLILFLILSLVLGFAFKGVLGVKI
ncbi:MAG: hypothetical protein HY043_00090 [Verrucomicrobia bacterium]|nr:hypothetical protein [Verrucomicrobiota bacterium]